MKKDDKHKERDRRSTSKVRFNDKKKSRKDRAYVAGEESADSTNKYSDVYIGNNNNKTAHFINKEQPCCMFIISQYDNTPLSITVMGKTGRETFSGGELRQTRNSKDVGSTPNKAIKITKSIDPKSTKTLSTDNIMSVTKAVKMMPAKLMTTTSTKIIPTESDHPRPAKLSI